MGPVGTGDWGLGLGLDNKLWHNLRNMSDEFCATIKLYKMMIIPSENSVNDANIQMGN